VSEDSERNYPFRCVFCRMTTATRVLRAPLCGICWDQVNDFIWVSFIQVALLAIGAIDGLFFVVEELLLFFVLIFVKHRIPPLLGRFTQTS
jgi:hypothetical protein